VMLLLDFSVGFEGIWGLRFKTTGLRAPDPRQGARPLDPHWGKRVPKPLRFRSASLGMNARCLFRFTWRVVPLRSALLHEVSIDLGVAV
jgi:hypothetical protein